MPGITINLTDEEMALAAAREKAEHPIPNFNDVIV